MRHSPATDAIVVDCAVVSDDGAPTSIPEPRWETKLPALAGTSAWPDGLSPAAATEAQRPSRNARRSILPLGGQVTHQSTTVPSSSLACAAACCISGANG